jgi:hypothetical protein
MKFVDVDLNFVFTCDDSYVNDEVCAWFWIYLALVQIICFKMISFNHDRRGNGSHFQLNLFALVA